MSTQKKQQGFTIIELMIATTIFTLVLMISLAAIMSITRMYYQGTLQARTQNKAREVVDKIADEIRYKPGDFIATPGPLSLSSEAAADKPEDYFGQYCIGDVRYRYLLGFMTTPDAKEATDANSSREASRTLLRETLPGGCDDDKKLADKDDVVDEFIEPLDDRLGLIDDNMRLLEFGITENGTDTFTVSVTLAYGGDDLIDYDPSDDEQQFTCKVDNVARAYCAISRLEVQVGKRI